MKVLLAGAGGRFGTMYRATTKNDVVVLPRAALLRPDDLLARERPEWLVNAAAMTDVDGCERDPHGARVANEHVPAALARACAAAGVRMLQVSTDYVFDGARGNYRETDPTSPISVYGATKLAGEQAVLTTLPDAVVARASVVFGTPGKPDFVSWLVGKLRDGATFPVVQDQRASPTNTVDLCAQVDALMAARARGIFHTAGRDALSRIEMANEVADLMGLPSKAEPVPMERMTWLAKRPRDSSLDVTKVSAIARPMSFRDAARKYLEALT